jgi:ABC-type sugar transport system ATPase subunit
MGRAIVRDPQAFLMDEPLSNLDAKLRVSTRAQLAALHDRLGVTTVYVTHDQIEAMTLGTRVAVLKDGQLQQVDTPQRLFDAPANLFVATFMGSPAMNLATARLVTDDGGPAVMVADYKLPVPERAIAAHPGLERYLDKDLIVGLRPSSLEDAAFAPPTWPHLKAQAQVTELLGSEVDVIFAVRTPPVEHEVMTVQFDKAATDQDPTAEHHDQTSGLVGQGESLWTAKLNPKTRARRGRAIDLAVDTSALYWFDPDSGLAIARQAAGDRPSTLQDATPPTSRRLKRLCHTERAGLERTLAHLGVGCGLLLLELRLGLGHGDRKAKGTRDLAARRRNPGGAHHRGDADQDLLDITGGDPHIAGDRQVGQVRHRWGVHRRQGRQAHQHQRPRVQFRPLHRCGGHGRQQVQDGRVGCWGAHGSLLDRSSGRTRCSRPGGTAVTAAHATGRRGRRPPR